MKTFAQILKECLQKKGINQQTLAQVLNLSHSTVSLWVNGKLTPPLKSQTLHRLALYLGVTEEILVNAIRYQKGEGTPYQDHDYPEHRKERIARLQSSDTLRSLVYIDTKEAVKQSPECRKVVRTCLEYKFNSLEGILEFLEARGYVVKPAALIEYINSLIEELEANVRFPYRYKWEDGTKLIRYFREASQENEL